MSEEATATRFEIHLPLGPRWKNVELMRSAILNCVAAVFHDTDASHAISVVAGELLENAVKYGDWQHSGDAFIALRVEGDQDEVELAVANPVADNPEGVRQLFATIDHLNSFESPRLAYQARLRELADSADEGISRLGLARIAYESNATLQATHSDGVVTVRALCLPTAGRA